MFQNVPVLEQLVKIIILDIILRNSDEGYLRELVPEDVCDTIMKYWKYASADEYDNIVNGIRHMGSAGVVVGGKLVSWAVCLLDGAIHALYTLEVN